MLNASSDALAPAKSSPLGSSATTNKDKTTFYGAMRVTYETLAAKYPGKKIFLVLPQKRYDEDTDYGRVLITTILKHKSK